MKNELFIATTLWLKDKVKVQVEAGSCWFNVGHTAIKFDEAWVKDNMVELCKLSDYIDCMDQDMLVEDEVSDEDKWWCTHCQKYVHVVDKYGRPSSEGPYCENCGDEFVS